MVKSLIYRLRSNKSLALYRRRFLMHVRRHLFGYRDVHPSSFIVSGSRVSRDLKTGQFCFVHTDCYVGPMVRLGNYVMLGPRVGIVGADHVTDIPGTPMVFSGRPEPKETVIGDDVWIGFGSIIMAGVRIGNGAIIGAGTVVTRDVGDYEVHVGVPNRHIADRFEGDVREEHEAMLHLPPERGQYCQPKMV